MYNYIILIILILVIITLNSNKELFNGYNSTIFDSYGMGVNGTNLIGISEIDNDIYHGKYTIYDESYLYDRSL